jgi:hypothetical protein
VSLRRDSEAHPRIESLAGLREKGRHLLVDLSIVRLNGQHPAVERYGTAVPPSSDGPIGRGKNARSVIGGSSGEKPHPEHPKLQT